MSDEVPPGAPGGGEPPKPKKAPKQWVPKGAAPAPPAAAPPSPTAAGAPPPAAPPAGRPKPEPAPPTGPAWEREPEAPEWRDASDDPLVGRLRPAVGAGLLAARSFAGDLVVEVELGAWRAAAAALREEGYRLLIDVTAADFPGREGGRFDVVAIAYSFEARRRVRMKARSEEGAEVPSLTPVWRGANWPEREIYDMYGVRFADHPDMTRLLLWEGFNGHPLRKDFPVEGLDTGSAIYPEYYAETAGPVAGTGTGWRPSAPGEGDG
jgi:NADH-quinone oxidoreductase subunit C